MRAELQEKFLEFKLAPKHTELLASKVRVAVDEVRQQEKAILDICVKDCKMPRKDFLKAFIDAEADPKWLRSVVRQKKPYAAAIKSRQSEIQQIQVRLGHIAKHTVVSVSEIKRDQPPHVDRRGQSAPRQKGNG